ncbi:OmpA family protein [candidate division KSB1 bacterium]|nr:OmpA family protein [candidate division KSB1 bacterium]
MSQAEKDIALRRLKEILLSEDEKRLAELEKELDVLKVQIADKESLIEMLDPVIADVLDRKIAYSREEFIDILSPIIGGSIRKQVSEAKDDIVDALYPIIGKTIRKSVAEAMKNLVDSVNRRIEKSLHSINIVNLFRSKITGVSQAELLVRDAVPFRIQEILLFSKANGLLIAHVGEERDGTVVDQELLSGLITAIQEFAPSAFTSLPQQDIYEFDYGDSTVRIEMQNHFYLAALIHGVMPDDFPERLNALGNRIHNRFYKTIREFDGDARPLAGSVTMLQNFIGAYPPEVPEPAHTSKPYVRYIISFIVLVAAILSALFYGMPYLRDRQLSRDAARIIVSDAELQKMNIQVKAQRRHIFLSGSVSAPSQKARIDSLVRTLPTVDGITNNVRLMLQQDEMVKRIDAALSPYLQSSEFEVKYIIEEDRVILEGYIPDPQIKLDISRIISDIESVRSVINNISHIKMSATEKLGTYLEQTKISFQLNGSDVHPHYHRRLCYIAAQMTQIGQPLIVAGYSDNLSSPDYNLTLSYKRARAVADYLESKSMAPEKIKIEYYGQDHPLASNATEEGRAVNRRVELRLFGSEAWHNL